MNDDRLCCDMMRSQFTHECEQHPDPFECPDVLVVYVPKYDEFGLPIHDGGSSYLLIRHCPWCGTSLPDSKRDLWFSALQRMGLENADDESIPDEFRSDLWWRRGQRRSP